MCFAVGKEIYYTHSHSLTNMCYHHNEDEGEMIQLQKLNIMACCPGRGLQLKAPLEKPHLKGKTYACKLMLINTHDND